MADGSHDPVLSAKAWELLNSMSRSKQKRVTRLIWQLADYPFRLGDYQTRDATGRPLENLQTGGFLFTYWTDSHAKELRILDIVEL